MQEKRPKAGIRGGMKLNNEFFEFEKLYIPILNEYYESRGWEYERVRGKENENQDLFLYVRGKKIPVEEKGLKYCHPDAPIELIQDIFSFNLGWFFKTKAERIMFIYYDKVKQMPKRLYNVHFPRLDEQLRQNWKEWYGRKVLFIRAAIEGYGLTINACVPWKYLIDNNMAWLLKEWEVPQEEDLFTVLMREGKIE